MAHGDALGEEKRPGSGGKQGSGNGGGGGKSNLGKPAAFPRSSWSEKKNLDFPFEVAMTIHTL